MRDHRLSLGSGRLKSGELGRTSTLVEGGGWGGVYLCFLSLVAVVLQAFFTNTIEMIL